MSDEDSALENVQRQLLLAYQRIQFLERQMDTARTAITYARANMTSTRLLLLGLIAELDAISAGKPNRAEVLAPLELALRATLITVTDFETWLVKEAEIQGCFTIPPPVEPPTSLVH